MSSSGDTEKQYTETELHAFASQVNESLELGMSEYTWRTSLRIFEILRTENPIMAQFNPFLHDYRRFITLIVGHTFLGLLTQAKIHDILAAKERYEEGESHPLIYEDVIGYGQKTRLGIFLEIHFHELFEKGYTFAEAIDKMKQSLLEVEKSIALGFTPGQIAYYRLRNKGGTGSKTSEPKLSLIV